MWKASAGITVEPKDDDGDWETDPDFINNVTEQEQRWGSKTIEGSGRTMGAIDMNKLREETTRAYELQKMQQKEHAPNAAYGYGGKFGIEKDRMDKSAVGHDYIAKVEKHMSQTDYSAGFGGKFGIQTDRVDKSAVSWDHKENIEKHASQKDYSSGFGGKFGVEKDRQDKSAVGWDHIEKLHKHDSQTVGKINNIIIEQTQKPSQLKAKFENLAKQNELKPLEKKKQLTIQKIAPVISSNLVGESPILKTTEIQDADKKENFNEVSSIRENQKFEIDDVEEKIKQVNINKNENQFSQEELPQLNQETTDKSQSELSSTEALAVPSENLAYQFPQNEINANVIVNENIYEQVEECYTAVALYDYQAAADDEISFDPDDIITNIEKIDEGWWRGTCNGETGLFPANYVQLKE